MDFVIILPTHFVPCMSSLPGPLLSTYMLSLTCQLLSTYMSFSPPKFLGSPGAVPVQCSLVHQEDGAGLPGGILFKVYSVNCTVCRMYCAVCRIQCAVCRMYCAVCRIQCAVCRLQNTVCRAGSSFRPKRAI